TGESVRASTYYPNATDAGAATAVAVVSGRTINGLVIGMQTAAGHEISGIVVNDAGEPVTNAAVLLMTITREGQWTSLGPIAKTGNDGGFAIKGVGNGDYWIWGASPRSRQREKR